MSRPGQKKNIGFTPRGRPSNRTIIVAIASALLVLFVLSARFRSDVGPYLGIFSNQATLHSVSENSDTTSGEDKFVLHPREHIFRAPRTIRHSWQITTGERRPDGVLKQVYLINGELLGPTIEARSGDRVIVNVTNRLGRDESLSIHWHGLHMRGANAMDGAAGVTQAGIKDGDSMVYDFVIDEAQHGTFWYHAHDGVQRADGLYGGLVIHEPAFGSEDTASVADETLLLIGDWYHRSAAEALEFYMHPGAFGLETIPDSILLNGGGTFNCADAVPARPVDCVQRQNVRPVSNFDRRRRNILRVVNVGAYAGFFINPQNSTLTPLTIDGGFSVVGHAAQSIGSLHPGQRMDLLLEPTNRAEEPNESLSIILDDAFFKYQNDALTMKQQFLLSWTGDNIESSGKGMDALQTLDIQGVKSLHTQSDAVASSVDRTIVLYAVTQRLAHLDNEPHGFINNTMWPSSPSSSALISQPPTSWSANHFIPHVPYDASSPLWIDIVLNNRDEEGHPFHLHGYSFWVLSTYSSDYNWGSYNPFEDEPPGGEYDLVNAAMRDTVYVPRRGYAVLRLRADNPGLWMFHCHVLWHMGSGMAMALDVS